MVTLPSAKAAFHPAGWVDRIEGQPDPEGRVVSELLAGRSEARTRARTLGELVAHELVDELRIGRPLESATADQHQAVLVAVAQGDASGLERHARVTARPSMRGIVMSRQIRS